MSYGLVSLHHLLSSYIIVKTLSRKSDFCYKGIPSKIITERLTAFDPEISIFMPCHVVSLGHYIFNGDFSMSSQKNDFYDLIYIQNGELCVEMPLIDYTAGSGDMLFFNNKFHYLIRKIGRKPLDILIIRNVGFIASSYYQVLMGRGFHSISVLNHKEIPLLLAINSCKALRITEQVCRK